MKNLTRRSFIQKSALGAAGLSVYPFIKGFASVPPSDQIRIGFIGLGRQGIGLMNGFHRHPAVKVVAGAEVFGRKRDRFEMRVKEHQEEKGVTKEIEMSENYQDMLERDDIDIIVIATPDHWHAIQTIDACNAGKDIYLEKPLGFTIREGIEVVNSVRENDVVLAMGSQQRSSHEFNYAAKLVREGRLGKLTKVNAWVGHPAVPYTLEEEPVPEDLNWDLWLGPNPYVHFNNELAPLISLDPVENEQFWAGWRWYKETGGGNLTDWGAHNFDIAQWALDKDDSGPVEVIPAGHNGYEYIHFVYEDGLVMANAPFTENENFGARFEGEDAWIEVHRGQYRTSEEELELPEWEDHRAPEVKEVAPHLLDFLDCVKNRKDPIATVEAGHRSGTLGILGNIATVLDRPLKWDPVNERFVNDVEANQHLHRDYREGYCLV